MADHRVGDVVTDWFRGLVAEVVAVNGDVLTLARPSGIKWPADEHHCRAAKSWEKEALDDTRLLHAEARKQETWHP